MLEHGIIISAMSSMLEQNSIITVIVSAMIGLSVALYVRYGIKPRIEKVFEKNRKSMLNGLLISANQVSNQYDNAHGIFETQDNFEWREEMAYDLTVNQVEGLRFIRREIQRMFNDIADRKDFLLSYFTINELEIILNYMANALSFFAIPENAQPNANNNIQVFYFPIRVDLMRRFGWRLINRFGLIINYDFVRRIRRYDGLTTLE